MIYVYIYFLYLDNQNVTEVTLMSYFGVIEERITQILAAYEYKKHKTNSNQ